MKLAAMLSADFQSAIVSLGNERIPMPVAYKLKKIVKQINEELTNYNELLKKSQDSHTNAEGVVDQAAFMKDYMQLVNVEVEVEKIHVKDLQNTTLSLKDLLVLEPILDDSET